MRRYETIYIISPGANEDDINAIIERTNGVIEKDGGTILQIDRWGLKKLAYPINKQNQGFYIYSEYAGNPEAVDEIERLFRIDEKVIKYMTIKTQEVYVPGELRPKAASEDAETAETVTDDDTDEDDNNQK